MKEQRIRGNEVSIVLVCLATVVSMPAQCSGQPPNLITLYSFQGGGDGRNPFGLVEGKGGVLYGVTSRGGLHKACADGCGTIFSLTPPASTGETWAETVLYRFTGEVGPSSGLVVGSDGVLYGTTILGGSANLGTVYSLAPPPGGLGQWTKNTLYSFTGSPDGSSPDGLIMVGPDLYGVTRYGGTGTALWCSPGNCGTIFSLKRISDIWVEQVLYSFDGQVNGWAPNGLISEGGVLYGPTLYGGTYGGGMIFSLTPPPSPGPAWTPSNLGSFNSVYGLAAGGGGVLYGASINGGIYNGGIAFSLTPPASQGGTWTQTDLHDFQTCPFSASCDEPSGVYYDRGTGAIYGLTGSGGSDRAGSVYALTPPAIPGQPWDYRILCSFDQSDGGDPDSLVVTPGLLYGTTAHKGSGDAGTVFSLAP